jgi:hypothetical protein
MPIKLIYYVYFLLILLSCSKGTNIPAASGNTGYKAHVYYVSPDGGDSNTGALDAPFKSINIALGKTLPGDTVFVRGGIYQEKLAFPNSGRLGKYISLKAYPGEKPVIDGTGLSISGKEALVTIRGVSFILFEGFDVCNFKSSTPWVNINGILVDGGSGNIQVRKNKVYNIEHNVALADGRSGHGIEIAGNTGTAMKNILVEENEIHDCKTGYSENLTINGYVDGFIIRKNTIYNAENIGIDAAGGYAANTTPAFNFARNGIITENILHNVESSRGPLGGYGAIGIYVDGARNITVERNKVYDTDRGIGIVSENDAYPTRNCIVRNNFVYNNWRTGIYLGGYLNSNTVTDSCYVVNNTLYYNNKIVGYYNEIEGELRLTENCSNNIIMNNLIYGRPGDLFVHKYTTTGGSNAIDNNLYYTTGTPAWLWNSVNGTPTTGFSAWKRISGTDAFSICGIDPLFTSTSLPDLHIQAASPAKNSGQVIPAGINGLTDIDGQPRVLNSRISIGAQQ